MPKDIFLNAFSSPVFQRQFDDKARLNAELAATIRELEKTNATHDRYRSHQGGFYTPGGLFEEDLPGISEIQNIMENGIRQYIEQVARTGFGRKPPVSTYQIKLDAWAALTREKDYQPPHVHAGANISGTYYVAAPDKPEPQGCIDLMNPLTSQEMTFIPGGMTTHCRVIPHPGLLLFFPAYLHHTVHPFFGAGERIVVVCNAYVRIGNQN